MFPPFSGPDPQTEHAPCDHHSSQIAVSRNTSYPEQCMPSQHVILRDLVQLSLCKLAALGLQELQVFQLLKGLGMIGMAMKIGYPEFHWFTQLKGHLLGMTQRSAGG